MDIPVASPLSTRVDAAASAPVTTASTAQASSATQNTAARTDNTETVTPERLNQAIAQANESFRQQGQNLYASFERDKLTGIGMVKIVDKKTNETVQQLPAKEMIAFARYLEDPQGRRGQLLDTTG